MMEKSVQRFLKQFNKSHKVDSIVPTDEEREELINLHTHAVTANAAHICLLRSSSKHEIRHCRSVIVRALIDFHNSKIRLLQRSPLRCYQLLASLIFNKDPYATSVEMFMEMACLRNYFAVQILQHADASEARDVNVDLAHEINMSDPPEFRSTLLDFARKLSNRRFVCALQKAMPKFVTRKKK